MVYPQERDETARQAWLNVIRTLNVQKLVFLDETSAWVNISRNYGWAETSRRVIDQQPKSKKERVSLMAAIGLKQPLAEHALIYPESVDKLAFKTYLQEVLLPKLEPNTVLVMDNWKVHHGQDIIDLVEAYQCSVLYLPTYSPDFNPIEFLFSQVKAFIKKLRPLTLPDLIQSFMDAVKTVSIINIIHSFVHCGYRVL